MIIWAVDTHLLQGIIRSPNTEFFNESYIFRNNEQSQPLFEEKYEEDPVIVMSEKNDVDIIGAPDSISNLRPIIRKKLGNETALQRQLREMQNATQEWNQEFWANHNANFIKV